MPLMTGYTSLGPITAVISTKPQVEAGSDNGFFRHQLPGQRRKPAEAGPLQNRELP